MSGVRNKLIEATVDPDLNARLAELGAHVEELAYMARRPDLPRTALLEAFWCL